MLGAIVSAGHARAVRELASTPRLGSRARAGPKPIAAQLEGNEGYQIPGPWEEKEKAMRTLAAAAKQLQLKVTK